MPRHRDSNYSSSLVEVNQPHAITPLNLPDSEASEAELRVVAPDAMRQT